MTGSARLALIVPGTLVAALVVPVQITTQHAAAQPAAAATVPTASTCEALEVGGACQFTYSQYPNGAVVDIPASLNAVTVVVSGASGAAGSGNRAGGGQGGMVVAVVDVDHSAGPLTIRLGQQGDGRTGGAGWSPGGEGGRSHGGRYGDGGGGGGSTAVGWAVEWPDHPFIVTGGGGGGGGNVGSDNPIPVAGGGGLGGTGGKPAGDGSTGSRPRAGNGAGGSGSGASGNGGGAGGSYDFDFDNSTAAGGGGGGGFHDGGGGGEIGLVGSCKINGKCPPDGAPGAGGGGGGGETFVWSKLPSQGIWHGIGAPGDGSVMVLAGTPTSLGCVNSSDPRTFDIPADVTAYGFIADGGAGARGHNSSGSEGHGASVSGVVDVTGLDSLQYWVGCSAYHHDGKGYGTPGGGGDAPLAGNKDGGWGGGASLVTDASGNPMFAAGGGGGSGGDASCVEDECVYYGGEAGNGGGVNGSNDRFGGEGGGGYSGFGGDGGCGGCNGSKDEPDPNGSHGGHAKDGGGGGGGGAGYPRGGDGGDGGSGFAGGGGGAGGSYLSGTRVSGGAVGTNQAFESGFILLIPITAAKTNLTVTKQVTGAAAAYATGPFAMAVECTINGSIVNSETFALGVSDSHTMADLPVSAECTVTETDAAGATVPAPPQTVTLVKDGVIVTMVNQFDASSIWVNLTSVITAADGGPNPGVAIELGNVTVAIACSFQGAPITVPSGSTLVFTGQETWPAAGQTLQVDGLPVGATCRISEALGSGATSTAYSVEGFDSPNPWADALVLGTPTLVGIIDTYALAPLEVAKVASGSGTPPSGATYAGAVSCTFQDRPVTLTETTFAMTVDSTTTVPNVPVGAQCTVDETDRGEATAVTYAPSATVPIAPASAPTTVTVTNQFSAEPLIVSVSNRGAGSRWANMPYEVTLVCTGTADQVLDFPATGGTQTVDVDANAECSIGSVNDTGQAEIDYASSTSPIWQPTPVTVTIPDGSGAGLEVSNLYAAAPLEVVSTTSGAGAAYANSSTTATVHECTFNEQPIDVEQIFTFPATGGWAIVPELPTGGACTVAQTESGGATTTGYVVVNGSPDNVSGGGATVTIHEPASGVATAVDITNTFDLAALTVTVEVAGDAAWAANVDFTVAVTCTFNDRPVTTLGPDGVATLTYSPQGVLQPSTGARAIASLPMGAECVSTEQQAGGATTVVFDPPGSPVSQSGPVRIALGSSTTITNTFDAAEYEVMATVSGVDASSHTDDLFFYEQSCTFNGQPISQSQTSPPWVSVFSLSDQQLVAFSGLPVGATCVVTEFDTSHATQVRPGTTEQAVLSSSSSLLSFDNVFDVAPVTIVQALEGDGAAVYGYGKTFDELISCSYADGGKADIPLPNRGWFALSPANDYTATFPVPVGAVCEIDQPDEQMATALDLSGPIVVAGSTSTTRSVVTTSTTGVLAAGASANVLTATDVYMLGGLNVAKSVTGPAPADATYEFGLTCSFGGQSVQVAQPASGTFEIADGQSYAATALSGATCALSETDSRGASSVTITAGGSTTDGPSTNVDLCWCTSPSAAFTNAFAAAPPTPSASGSASGSTPTAQGGALSVTGSPIDVVAGLGILLILAGAAAVGGIRPRPSHGRRRA